MQFITQTLTLGLLLWFVLAAIIVFGRILNGDIDTTGMLQNKTRRGKQVAAERAISVLTFPVVIASYAYIALHADMSVVARLPEPPEQLLMLLTGSNAVYLAGKIARN